MKIEAYLRESPLIAIIAAGKRMEAHVGRLFRAKDLNLTTALVLVSIFLEDPRPVTPTALSDVLFMTRGNVSHAVSMLEANGMLARQIDPDDARMFHLVLKPHGRKTAMQVVRILHRMQTSFEKNVGNAQLKLLSEVIARVEGSLN